MQRSNDNRHNSAPPSPSALPTDDVLGEFDLSQSPPQDAEMKRRRQLRTPRQRSSSAAGVKRAASEPSERSRAPPKFSP